MTTIVLIGTLDTKGAQDEYLRDRIRILGAHTILIDAGTGGPPTVGPDVAASEVAAAAGIRLADLTDRGEAVAAMSRGAEVISRRLCR